MYACMYVHNIQLHKDPTHCIIRSNQLLTLLTPQDGRVSRKVIIFLVSHMTSYELHHCMLSQPESQPTGLASQYRKESLELLPADAAAERVGRKFQEDEALKLSAGKKAFARSSHRCEDRIGVPSSRERVRNIRRALDNRRLKIRAQNPRCSRRDCGKSNLPRRKG